MKRSFWCRLQILWCKLTHPVPMWPIRGYYRCPACLREYSVPWGGREGAPAGPSALLAGVHSAAAEASGFGIPQLAYADSRRRNPL
jgi:hypothetical protein